VAVVVSVDQWADMAEELGGACAHVSTVVGGSSGDPHDFEPTPADIKRFSDARVVVLNGAGYDAWAEKAVDSWGRHPLVVDAGQVVGRAEGANPHLWYDPASIDVVAASTTAALREAAPEAAGYFDDRAIAWREALQPYRDEVAGLRALAAGRSYAATEAVFDDMAEALGLADVTPAGYHNAAANESEPAPGDIDALLQALAAGKVDVLIVNSQTEGAVPHQFRRAAEAADVPVVQVTETLAPDADGFVDWQVGQLRALAAVLSEGS
jgi:zinc/manganese transport system substrate-binding protein